MRVRALPAGLVLAAVLAAGAALASGNAPWQALTPAQQEILRPLERDWASIDRARQRKWIEITGRYPTLPAEEQVRVRQRMLEWARMTQEERRRARLTFQDLRDFSADERQARWQAYNALPDERKRSLAKQAEAAPKAASTARAKPPATAGAKTAAPGAPAATVAAKPVGPAVVLAKPGVSTRLVSEPAKPPAHQQTGLPKIVATPGFVDPKTLLPRRGAQGAAVAVNGSASAPDHP